MKPSTQPLRPLAQGTPNFNELELSVLKYWREASIHERQKQLRQDGAVYTVYDGPPTANAKPGIHHLLPSAFKDAAIRYHTLLGKKVRRQPGWDTHGLPVEVQVEKAKGLKGKKDVLSIVAGDERASVQAFNEACRESVMVAKESWEWFIERIGRWSDQDSYITYNPDYIDGVWAVLKKAWDSGLVYKDYKVIPHCPRCVTSLSSAEVAQGYIDVPDRSAYVKFKLSSEKSTYIVAWTTTPWTLPGNVALAVGGDIEYAAVSYEGETLILAHDRLEAVFGERPTILSRMKGSDLVGKTYEPLFSGIMDGKPGRRYEVVEANFVTTTDGSGVVHTACMYGEDDFTLGKELGLTMEHTVDLDGVFMAHTPFAGKSIIEATEPILSQLASAGLLLKEERYTHSYPHCWRCKTPLIYYAKDSWFIAVSSLRERLQKANSNVRWIPDHVKEGRFGDFITEARDWAISRERFWGAPLPIWKGDGGTLHCFASRAELEKVSGVALGEDPHRPFIDDITYTVNGERFTREPYVLDVWFESGAMPWASGMAARGEFPAQYIAEAVDQTRGWFYTLMVLGVIMEDISPYETVTCMGHFLDSHGRKMSKSLGNILVPEEVFEKTGADAVRFYAYTVNAPGESKMIGVDEVTKASRRVLVPLWNMVSFLQLRDNLGKHEVENSESLAEHATQAMDKWLLSEHKSFLHRVKDSYDDYDFTKAGRLIEEYVTTLSTWYLRRSRKRNDEFFTRIFTVALKELSICMVPLTPMIAESVYLAVRSEADEESVHFEKFPTVSKLGKEDEARRASMDTVRSIVEMGMRLRASEGIKVRQPLAALSVAGVRLEEGLQEIVADELNVLQVLLGAAADTWPSVTDNGLTVALDVRLSDELRVKGALRELTRNLQQLRKDNALKQGQLARLLVEREDLERVRAMLVHDDQLLEGISLFIDENSERVGLEREIPLFEEDTARVGIEVVS